MTFGFVQTGPADHGAAPGYYEIAVMIPAGSVKRYTLRPEYVFRGRVFRPVKGSGSSANLQLLEFVINGLDMLAVGSCPLRLLEWSDITLESTKPGGEIYLDIQNTGKEPVTWWAEFHGVALVDAGGGRHNPHPGAGGSD